MFGVKRYQVSWWFGILIMMALGLPLEAGRTNKMFDVSQYARPEWGLNWCAPTAVGNSFAWLAREYPSLGGLANNQSIKDLIGKLGKDYMKTDPDKGTTAENILKGKQAYIEACGLKDKIIVETRKSPPKSWIKEQYKKGQDIELGLGYYKLENGKWVRVNGHVITYIYGSDDSITPGYDAGGHVISVANILDSYGNDLDTDYKLTFTDPGRNETTTDGFGAIAFENYTVSDALGNSIACTATTYNVRWAADLLGDGIGGYYLEGYQGEGDFGAPLATTRTKFTLIEYAWAESPVPAPGAILLASLGMTLVGYLRGRRGLR